ncbi:MAG: hypothetical protein JWO81_2470 [Alphaproteobacteria bacterium]|nr:hypothetical protein [Alphaproteobacteria bacterium]
MRRLIVAIGLSALAAIPAQARYVSAGYDKSWGKVGVSLAAYRGDAVACGRQAASLDLAGSDPARALVLASRLIDNAPDVETASDAMRIASPERNFLKAGDLLQAALERCLTQRGYRRFKLTSGQRHRLSELPIGSDARHAYLHSLASNPDVLTRQAVD